MKRFSLFLALMVGLMVFTALLAACQGMGSNPTADQSGWNATDPQTLMIPRWFLNSLVIDGKAVDLGDKQLTLQFEEGGKANGAGGCNSFFADYKVSSSGSLTFGGIGATKMACELGMDLDQDYFRALSQVEQFRTEDGKLTVSSADGKTTLIYNLPPK